MALSFFSTRKPRPFHYTPQYYDEEKEKQEKRKRELERSEHRTVGFERGELKEHWLRSNRSRTGKKQSVNFIVYLIIILILLFIIFF
jgi:hypothetical protein